MQAAPVSWLTEHCEMYMENAAAARDFRVQMRGYRSVLLFGLYLFVLIGVAAITYQSAVSSSAGQVIDAQQRLHGFYQTAMAILALAVCLVAPGLAATTVVMERQRRSLDLVFSAPVSPKYYLVGKMIASFRYTWMLIVLTLPVLAASVVLGGASWMDVLIACVLVSFQALVITAFALLISVLSPKPAAAILWSYMATLAYCYASGSLTSVGMGSYADRRGAGSLAPFWVTICPFTVSDSARSYSLLFGHAVPNWILLMVVALLVVKICLLGAASALDPSRRQEVVGLRIHALIYTLVIFGVVGWNDWPKLLQENSNNVGFLMTTTWASPSVLLGITVVVLTAPMIAFVPILSCFGFDREQRFRPNGLFSVESLLDGTPAGGLPFLLTWLMTAFASCEAGAVMATGQGPDLTYCEVAAFGIAFWLLFWSLGRLLSTAAKDLTTSRSLTFCMFILLVVIPIPFMSTIHYSYGESSSPSWQQLYILSPILSRWPYSDARCIIFTIGLLLCVALFTAMSQEKERRLVAP